MRIILYLVSYFIGNYLMIKIKRNDKRIKNENILAKIRRKSIFYYSK